MTSKREIITYAYLLWYSKGGSSVLVGVYKSRKACLANLPRAGKVEHSCRGKQVYNLFDPVSKEGWSVEQHVMRTG